MAGSLKNDPEARNDIIFLYRQGRSYSVIHKLTGYAITTIARFLSSHPDFFRWKEESKLNRKRGKGRRLQRPQISSLVVYPPNPLRPVETCPKCYQQVHLSDIPGVPCFACQIREAGPKAELCKP